jgi:hypothetical protein
MQDRNLRCSRRKFLASAAALTLASGAKPAPGQPLALSPVTADDAPSARKPIAVVTTVYRALSHSYHVANRFLYGYTRNGLHHTPQHYVHSLCVDQTPDNDLSRELARKDGVRVTRTVSEALLNPDGSLAVDGVLLIAEHGNYPRNDKGQILYPRLEMMGQIVETFRRAGRSVPVFNDKHLSYTLAHAHRMIGWSRDLHFPLMAGSTLPLTWRRPELELPLETPLADALVAGHGPLEVSGFDALEALQGMLERRQGGETGVRAVTCLTGPAVWKAGDLGLWSWDLLHAALRRSETVNVGDVRRNVGSMAVQTMPPAPAAAFLIEYRDGARGAVLLLNGHVQDFTFAARTAAAADPVSCLFHAPAPPGAKHFDALVANIETLLETGRSPQPIERTLLTTGLLDALMESHRRRGERIETPELDVSYHAPSDGGFLKGGVAAAG